MSFLYLEAAKALRKVADGKSGLKNAIFAAEGRNVKRTYAIVCEALKHRSAMETAMAKCSGLQREAAAEGVDHSLLLIMIFELLWGAGKIAGGGKVKRLIMKYEDELRASTGRPKGSVTGPGSGSRSSALESTAAELASQDGRPRFVRVNTLKCTVDEVVSTLTGAPAAKKAHKSSASGGSGGGAAAAAPDGAAATAAATASAAVLAPEEVVPSSVVPYVLRLPPTAHARLQLHEHPLVTGGGLILQDLASAFPAHALLGEGWPATTSSGGSKGAGAAAAPPLHVIDACAAPGNKTSQLAALLAAYDAARMGTSSGGAGSSSSSSSSSSRVTAYDRDPRRLELLQRRMVEAGAAVRVTAVGADFLSTDPSAPDCRDVRAILLDPSCSGSGMQQQLHVDKGLTTTAATAGGSGSGAAGGAGGQVSGKKRKRSEEEEQEKEKEKATTAAAATSGTAAAADATAGGPPPVSERDAKRVRSLSDFQTRALLHALSFPSVHRVVYSTCSVYAEEDEAVVAAALSKHNAAVTDPAQKARLVRCLPGWPRRGYPVSGLSPAQAACCIRADPTQDETTGFFTALFVKGKE